MNKHKLVIIIFVLLGYHHLHAAGLYDLKFTAKEKGSKDFLNKYIGKIAFKNDLQLNNPYRGFILESLKLPIKDKTLYSKSISSFEKLDDLYKNFSCEKVEELNYSNIKNLKATSLHLSKEGKGAMNSRLLSNGVLLNYLGQNFRSPVSNMTLAEFSKENAIYETINDGDYKIYTNILGDNRSSQKEEIRVIANRIVSYKLTQRKDGSLITSEHFKFISEKNGKKRYELIELVPSGKTFVYTLELTKLLDGSYEKIKNLIPSTSLKAGALVHDARSGLSFQVEKSSKLNLENELDRFKK